MFDRLHKTYLSISYKGSIIVFIMLIFIFSKTFLINNQFSSYPKMTFCVSHTYLARAELIVSRVQFLVDGRRVVSHLKLRTVRADWSISVPPKLQSVVLSTRVGGIRNCIALRNCSRGPRTKPKVCSC